MSHISRHLCDIRYASLNESSRCHELLVSLKCHELNESSKSCHTYRVILTRIHPIADRVAQHFEMISIFLSTNQNSAHGTDYEYHVIKWYYKSHGTPGPTWKLVEIISRFCATLAAIGSSIPTRIHSCSQCLAHCWEMHESCKCHELTNCMSHVNVTNSRTACLTRIPALNDSHTFENSMTHVNVTNSRVACVM